MGLYCRCNGSDKTFKTKGFPKIFGNNFFLAGYRVFVRYIDNSGKRLRGLYILKSETDKKKMELLGNIFTHYKYTTTDICQTRHNDVIKINSINSGFKVIVDTSVKENISLPDGSLFSDWREARRFAGSLPFTFAFNNQTKKVIIIEGVRENWIPTPVSVLDYSFSFLDKMKLHDFNLANSFIIKNIPYYWKKGRIESWTA